MLLQGKVAGIDTKRKEQYLSAADFQRVFHMDRDEWAQLPEWKRQQAKRAAGLF